MPYLFLVATGIALTVMSLLRKEYDRRTQGLSMASYVFIGITYTAILLASFVYFLASGSLGGFAEVDALTLLLAVGFALATFITTVICIVGASYGSVSIIVVFANLGTVTLSTVYGLLFDAERNKPTVFTWIGLLLVLAIILMNFLGEKKTAQAVGTPGKKRIYKLLCFFVFFTNGIALVIYSMLTTHRPGFGYWHFISLYSALCVVFALVCVLFVLFRQRGKQTKERVSASLSRVTLLLIVLYAVFFLLGELMSLANTTMLPIIIHAPLSFAVPVIILTVSECLIYRVRLTRDAVIKMILALAGSVLTVL